MKQTLKLLLLLAISGFAWLGCSDDDDDKNEPQEVYRGSCQASVTAAGSTTLPLNCIDVFSEGELTDTELCPPQPPATVTKLDSECAGTLGGSCRYSANGKNIRQDHYNINRMLPLGPGGANVDLAVATAATCQGEPINGTWTAAP